MNSEDLHVHVPQHEPKEECYTYIKTYVSGILIFLCDALLSDYMLILGNR